MKKINKDFIRYGIELPKSDEFNEKDIEELLNYIETCKHISKVCDDVNKIINKKENI